MKVRNSLSKLSKPLSFTVGTVILSISLCYRSRGVRAPKMIVGELPGAIYLNLSFEAWQTQG